MDNSCRRYRAIDSHTLVSSRSLVEVESPGLSRAWLQAVQMRLIRRQRAEEQAQKVPVKILFPMLLCIFPALFIVIIGPGAIRIINTFSGING